MLTPLVERWFLQGKYHLAAALVLATVVSGVIKIINAFTKAAASALATPRELGMVNLLGWVSLAIGIGAGIVGARWGLARRDLRGRARVDHPRRDRVLHRRPAPPTLRARAGGPARHRSVTAGPADDNADWAVALFNRSVLKQEKFRRITELIEDPVGRTSLDIGADNGTISYLLRQRGGRWYSADLDERAVASIRELVRDCVYQLDGSRTPFANAAFDQVVVVDYLEHIPDDDAFARGAGAHHPARAGASSSTSPT